MHVDNAERSYIILLYPNSAVNQLNSDQEQPLPIGIRTGYNSLKKLTGLLI